MAGRNSAKVKGYIKNNASGVLKSFQYNPTSLQYSRGATYVEISAPGMPYPRTQFVRGNSRTFPVELFMYDRPSTGLIADWRSFLEGFLPPETNQAYEKPPEMLYCMAYFIRRCVLEDFQVNDELFDEKGNPVQTRFTLSLRQVGV